MQDSTTVAKSLDQDSNPTTNTEATHANTLPGSNHNHQSTTSPTTNSITVSFTTRMPNSDSSNGSITCASATLVNDKHQDNGVVNNGIATKNSGNNNSVTSAIITPTVGSRGSESPVGHHNHERRPSWRLKVDNGSKVSF